MFSVVGVGALPPPVVTDKMSRVGVISNPANWDAYRQRVTAYETGNRNIGPVSGVGSSPQAAAPLVKFLKQFLAAHPGVRSIVEASCGHWPSGWQSKVRWPNNLNYTGVDLLVEQTDANARLVAKRGGPAAFGLAKASFLPMDMVHTRLPRADLLLTKDTLIHFTNEQIATFLSSSVITCPPRFKYVLFAHDELLKRWNFTSVPERAERGRDKGHHFLDMALPPFRLNVTTVAVYPSGRCCRKAVQLLDLTDPGWCPSTSRRS